MSATQVLTVDDLDRMEHDPRWLGFGYLGGRSNAPDADRALVDAEVLRIANDRSMDYEGLFAWANSKTGRWFADTTFGNSGNLGSAFADAERWNLTPR